MSLRERYVIAGGTNLMQEFDLHYSDFDDIPPKPKSHIVDIPAGIDLDITEALGPVAFHNGTHKLVMLLYSEDAIDREADRLKGMLHGKMLNYQLSWRSGYTYRGRWVLTETKYLGENACLVTVEISKRPFGTKADSATINAHPTASYTIEGSARYKNVSITLAQNAMVYVDGELVGTYAAGTTVILPTLAQDAVISVTVADWYYYIDGTNLVVNPIYYTLNGSNVQFVENSPFVIDGTNVRCDAEAQQYATISFIREDF